MTLSDMQAARQFVRTDLCTSKANKKVRDRMYLRHVPAITRHWRRTNNNTTCRTFKNWKTLPRISQTSARTLRVVTGLVVTQTGGVPSLSARLYRYIRSINPPTSPRRKTRFRELDFAKCTKLASKKKKRGKRRNRETLKIEDLLRSCFPSKLHFTFSYYVWL